ncbi:MAG: PhnD/SsuA/transferrin family substrate-binding protein [Bacteroidales bacterium]|nr:PhnD/SsuA/transferrin family substrate-binding protein [Bacteroidales bacterium]
MNDKQKLGFTGNRKWVILTVFFFFVLVHSTAFTQENQVKIGVLAKRGHDITLKLWEPTAEYLSAKIPGKTFVIVPIPFEQIYSFVENGKVDFILANSSFYVELEHWYGANRLVTLKNLRTDGVYTEFAGVIFCKANRGDIRELTDIKGKTFMAVKETSLGGWRMAWREFKELGIDPYHDFKALSFGGTHDAVVYAVRDGEVDAGTIRTDVFERMQAEGKIDIKDYYVVPYKGGKTVKFPFLHSTRGYPEWPMAKVRHTSDTLAEKVAVALLEMPPNSDAAKAGQCAGWTIPMNYQSVHECLRELKVGPYKDLGKITLASLIQQYWPWILLGFIGIIILVAVTIYVIRLNRKLKISTIELRESRNILEQKVEERTSELRQSNQSLQKENMDRRQAEKALQMERDNFKNILGSMEDGVYIVNKEYEIEYLNPMIIKEFGPVNTHNCYEYLHGRTEVCPWCKILDVLAGKTVRWEWYSSKNQRTYDLIDTPFRNPDGSISKLEIFRDITKRMHVEEELKKHREHLEEMVKERTQELEGFSYSISHDLRAPLRAINGFSEILSDDYKDKLDEEAKRLLNIIRKNSLNMNQLITDLLDFSRLGRQQLKTVKIDMKALVRKIFDELKEIYPKRNIEFKLGEIPPATGDRNLVRLVFVNLISNAIKFTEPGKIARIEIGSLQKNKQLFYYVNDNGIGFEMKYAGKIFGVFQRLHSSGEFEGTGVGLAIVQKIIHKHGGEVIAEGEVNKGATFYFSLPKE